MNKYISEYNSYEKNLFSQVDRKPEVFIANLIKDLEVKVDENRPHITYFRHKETGYNWMVDNKKTKLLLVSNGHIWSEILISFPHLKGSKVSRLIKYVVETGFKVEVGNPDIWWSG